MTSESNFKSISKITWKTALLIVVFYILSVNSTSATNYRFIKGNHSLTEMQDDKQEKTVIFYIVDGEPMSAKDVDKLKIEDIEQMEYVKEKEKIKLYTDEDVDTVVLITTKNQKKKEN